MAPYGRPRSRWASAGEDVDGEAQSVHCLPLFSSLLVWGVWTNRVYITYFRRVAVRAVRADYISFFLDLLLR